MKDERLTGRSFDGHDFADEYDMVAGRMPAMMAAFEPRDASVDQRCIGPAQTVRDAGKTIGMRTRKPARQVGVAGRQHVDCVALRRLESGEAC